MNELKLFTKIHNEVIFKIIKGNEQYEMIYLEMLNGFNRAFIKHLINLGITNMKQIEDIYVDICKKYGIVVDDFN